MTELRTWHASLTQKERKDQPVTVFSRNKDIFCLADCSRTYQVEIIYSYAFQIENGAFLGENRETQKHEK